MFNIFKCAESTEHVNKANITVGDIDTALYFCTNFDIELSVSPEEIRAMAKDKNSAELHDLVHMVMDDVVKAYRAGHEMLNDPIIGPLMEQLAKKQEECRHGSQA